MYRTVIAFTLLLATLLSASPLAQAKDKTETITVSRADYAKRLEGFWLGQSIANWSGLITEMDKVKAPFYTDADWGKRDQPSVWGSYTRHATKIGFYILPKGRVWGSDDDTDIEYMYLHLMHQHGTGLLSAKQIQHGWLKHTYSNEDAPIDASEFQRENFLWVSNERARELMTTKNMLPPHTSDPKHNEHYNMIDAQLTTELFGLMAPMRPDIAKKIAHLPIRTTAGGNAEIIAQFYVNMHANALSITPEKPMAVQMLKLADAARSKMPEMSLPAKMYDFIRADYMANPDKDDWETTRDKIYQLYQLDGKDGYKYKIGFDAEINFAASIVSLLYGEGNFKRTVQIGMLTGWDSDNPTATWGGLLGFIYGADKVKSYFADREIPTTYWITRTRRNFPDYTPKQLGEDTFELMAKRGLQVIDIVVNGQMKGRIDQQKNTWIIPIH